LVTLTLPVLGGRLHVSEILSNDLLGDVYEGIGYQFMPYSAEWRSPAGEWIRRDVRSTSWLPVSRNIDTILLVQSAAYMHTIDTAISNVRTLGLDIRDVEQAMRRAYQEQQLGISRSRRAITLFRKRLAHISEYGSCVKLEVRTISRSLWPDPNVMPLQDDTE